MVLLERWGERLGSLGREWTQWLRLAERHGDGAAARRIARLVDARAEDAIEKAEAAPIWLQERIALAHAGRRAVGEEVSEAENARDQLAAFEIIVPRRFDSPWGDWIRLRTSEQLAADLEELASIVAGAEGA